MHSRYVQHYMGCRRVGCQNWRPTEPDPLKIGDLKTWKQIRDQHSESNTEAESGTSNSSKSQSRTANFENIKDIKDQDVTCNQHDRPEQHDHPMSSLWPLWTKNASNSNMFLSLSLSLLSVLLSVSPTPLDGNIEATQTPATNNLSS